MFESNHFSVERPADGVYACIHKPGGAAYSNALIVDLGGRTLVVDAMHTLAAGRDLHRAAEALCGRPVQTLLLTHAHGDHWIGASAFPDTTALLATEITRQGCLEWGPRFLEDHQNPAELQEWLGATEERLRTEQDERVRAGLEATVVFIGHMMAELADYQPRYVDQTFEDSVTLEGTLRSAQVHSLGRGHSEEDAVLLLPEDGIAFIGDVGFFQTQPFLGVCDLDGYRRQMLFVRESGYQVLVPGHGPVGGPEAIDLHIEYMDVLERLVGQVVQQGGSLDEALQIALPAPFDAWLVGGMERFQINVRSLFEHCGGEVAHDD